MTSVLVWATVVALILKVPAWAGVFLCGITGISFLLFLVAYIYLFANDREMLRAERYRGARLVKRLAQLRAPKRRRYSWATEPIGPRASWINDCARERGQVTRTRARVGATSRRVDGAAADDL